MNVQILHERAEFAGQAKEYREQFTVVTSRAVAHLRVLCEWALPFVARGGYFLAWKGPKGAEEASAAQRAIRELGGTLCEVRKLQRGEWFDERVLCIIQKVQATPKRFPRAPGKAAKQPL